jgi:hypothetical protein
MWSCGYASCWPMRKMYTFNSIQFNFIQNPFDPDTGCIVQAIGYRLSHVSNVCSNYWNSKKQSIRKIQYTYIKSLRTVDINVIKQLTSRRHGPWATYIWVSHVMAQSEFSNFLNGDLSAAGENPDRKNSILEDYGVWRRVRSQIQIQIICGEIQGSPGPTQGCRVNYYDDPGDTVIRSGLNTNLTA